jgi:hypothetical protein
MDTHTVAILFLIVLFIILLPREYRRALKYKKKEISAREYYKQETKIRLWIFIGAAIITSLIFLFIYLFARD